MKLTVERKWKKADYTIGRLYIDGEYVCNTLEPVDRGLANTAKPGDTDSEQWHQADKNTKEVKALYTAGTTAIPTGHYRICLSMSQKFHGMRMFLRDVPGFLGVMIHEGNYPKNTQGCILVGENSKQGAVMMSRNYEQLIRVRVKNALDKGDIVILRVK